MNTRDRHVYNNSSLLFKILARLLKYKGRSFQYRQIRARYPSLKYLIPEAFNITSALIGRRRSFRPVVVGIEPLNMCNLSCLECEVNRGMKRPKGIMDFVLFKKIVDGYPYFLRINMTNYGEPLLHKDILKMISYANGKKVITIFTNATLLSDEMSIGLIDAGLKVICFSLDGLGEAYRSVRGWDYDDVEHKITGFLEINQKKGNPVLTEINMVEFGPTSGQWEKVQEAWKDKIDIMMKSPLMQNKSKRKRRCYNLWRSMVVLCDGTVVPCCVDREMQMKIGDVKEKNLLEIFNGGAMKELREKHVKGEFPELCATCDEFFG